MLTPMPPTRKSPQPLESLPQALEQAPHLQSQLNSRCVPIQRYIRPFAFRAMLANPTTYVCCEWCVAGVVVAAWVHARQ